MSDIGQWLAERELAQFTAVFSDQQINVADLPDLREVRIPVKPITDSRRSRSVSPVKPITYRSEATRVLDYGAK